MQQFDGPSANLTKFINKLFYYFINVLVIVSPDLRAAEQQNHLDAYIGLAKNRDGEVRQFGPITAISTGVPHTEFNRVFVFEPPSHDDFTAAMEWVEPRDGPFWLTTTETTSQLIEDIAADHGFRKVDRAHLGWYWSHYPQYHLRTPSSTSSRSLIQPTSRIS